MNIQSSEQNKLRRQYWRPFNVLLVVGFIYLCASIILKWDALESASNKDITYLNKVFSDTVRLTLDQYGTTLDVTGQRLATAISEGKQDALVYMLDDILYDNEQLAGFGYFDVDGNMIVGDSNIDKLQMPNLLKFEKTGDTFKAALESSDLIPGLTYYFDQVDSWIIPIRKSIHLNGQLSGVMTAGLLPDKLVPDLQKMETLDETKKYIFVLVHDETYITSFTSGFDDKEKIKIQYETPYPDELVDIHISMVKKLSGLSLDEFRRGEHSINYIAPDEDWNLQFVSVTYIAKYRMWSVVTLGLFDLLPELVISGLIYAITFIAVFIIIYLLFRRNYRSIENSQNTLLYQACHDPLTGLHNRQYIYSTEPEWLRDEEPFSVLFIDLDNFKLINDSYGHDLGDQLLIQLSNRLSENLPEHSVLCRPGGDEFIILCRGDEAEVEGYVKKLLYAITRPYMVDPYIFVIKASLGISRYPRDGKTFRELFSAADSAMFESKKNFLDYCIYSSEMAQRQSQRLDIEQALHHALVKDEIYLEYQPQFDMEHNIIGVEALARWNSKTLGEVSPTQFVLVAEGNGQIIDIGKYILNKSIADMSANSEILGDIQLSVNISIRQLQYAGFKADLQQILDHHNFPRERLTLEITESILAEDAEYLIGLLIELQSDGIRVSLDDFGTGYSSLSLLRKLPLNEIKIDKSFIDGLLLQASDELMIKSVIQLAKVLGLSVVAEGVENSAQAELLSDMGCNYQQGYLHSRPVSLVSLLQLLKKAKGDRSICRM